jgi:hypothetical protein
MTIETAVPSSAETLAALFDQLVEAVAQRVKIHLTGPVFESHVKAALVNLDMDSQIGNAARAEIEAWADDHLDDRLDHWATYKFDIEGDINRALRDADLTDTIEDTIKNLTFEVTVS